MDELKPKLVVKQERFVLQAHFATPVFDLFKDLPSLVRQLFQALDTYRPRLADLRFETGNGSFGDACLKLAWPTLAEVRIFLDRIEVESTFAEFLWLQDRDLVRDVLEALVGYASDIRFLTCSVTREAHGELAGQSRSKFLGRFLPELPQGFGPALGAGMVFYFGAEADRLATSVTLDFSRIVDGGIFLQSVVLYDASQLPLGVLQDRSRTQLQDLLQRIGLEA